MSLVGPRVVAWSIVGMAVLWTAEMRPELEPRVMRSRIQRAKQNVLDAIANRSTELDATARAHVGRLRDKLLRVPALDVDHVEQSAIDDLAGFLQDSVAVDSTPVLGDVVPALRREIGIQQRRLARPDTPWRSWRGGAIISLLTGLLMAVCLALRRGIVGREFGRWTTILFVTVPYAAATVLVMVFIWGREFLGDIHWLFGVGYAFLLWPFTEAMSDPLSKEGREAVAERLREKEITPRFQRTVQYLTGRASMENQIASWMLLGLSIVCVSLFVSLVQILGERLTYAGVIALAAEYALVLAYVFVVGVLRVFLGYIARARKLLEIVRGA